MDGAFASTHLCLWDPQQKIWLESYYLLATDAYLLPWPLWVLLRLNTECVPLSISLVNPPSRHYSGPRVGTRVPALIAFLRSHLQVCSFTGVLKTSPGVTSAGVQLFRCSFFVPWYWRTQGWKKAISAVSGSLHHYCFSESLCTN